MTQKKTLSTSKAWTTLNPKSVNKLRFFDLSKSGQIGQESWVKCSLIQEFNRQNSECFYNKNWENGERYPFRTPPRDPICYPHANRSSSEPQAHEGISLPEGEISALNPSEMINFTKYLQKNADIQPRTYWWEFPFYTIIRRFRQKYCLGERPEDLDRTATIEKRAWERHLAHQTVWNDFLLKKQSIIRTWWKRMD